ncbi:dipeptidase [Amycolatopsis jejuensis]|uniref:dipeptidase n=1 Tax=Amycolatopsis jejuensis TaxID=330084 RepID=UPI000690CD29|nr:membrane dipeptidase [Amycolatopsis jejuensis]
MIVDAHNDLLVELWLRRHEPNPFGRHLLEPLRAGGVGVQVCALSAEDAVLPGAAGDQLLHQAAAFHKACRANREHVQPVRTAADLESALASGRIGLILALEGVDGLGRNAAAAEVLVEAGVRMVGLTWNHRNAAADGCSEPPHGGVSVFGRELTERLVALGVIMDVAHANARTFDDVLELTSARGGQVLCSHTGCAALNPIPRNLTDSQLRALRAVDGVVGIAAVPMILGSADRSAHRMAEHICHAIDVAGVEHVGIGADFMARSAEVVSPPKYLTERLPPGVDMFAGLDGLEGPQHFPALAEALQRRGLSDAEIDAVLSGNMLRLLRKALP